MPPVKHARLSVSRWGGKTDDYLALHEFIDATKALCSDNRHRILHTHWALDNIILPIFGRTTVNSEGRQIATKELVERDHFLPDFQNKFIPTLSDFANAMGEPVDAGMRKRIEQFHSRFALHTDVGRLLLSPLAVTGRLNSLLFTHNSWFINEILPQIHPQAAVIEDFSITPADIFSSMELQPWMNNGLCLPSSVRGSIQEI